MPKLTPRERFKQQMRERNLIVVEEPAVKKVVLKKPNKKVVKVKPVKKDPHEILTKYGLKINRPGNYKDGWTKDPEKIAEYQKQWRKNNQDKIKKYREEIRNNPIKRAKRIAYEKNRPNKLSRLEQTKLRYRKNMEDPLFVAKERLRGKLRRTKPDYIGRVSLEKQYKEAVIAWKEKHDKTK